MLRRLSFSVTLGLALPFVAILLTLQPQYDPDMWWHIRSGQVMLETGQVIRGDMFSHTMPGVLRPHHEWLSQPVMAWFYNTMGHTGNQWFVLLYVLGIATLAHRLTAGHPLARAVILLLGFYTAKFTWLARPQLAMQLLGLLVFGITVRWRRRLWALPLISLLWVNLHGSWFMLFIIGGAAWAGEAWQLWRKSGGDPAYLRRLTVWLLASVPVLLINPYGLDQLYVLLDTFTQAARSYINEWKAPSLSQKGYLPFWILLAATPLMLRAARRFYNPAELLIVVGFGLWALTSGRMVAMFGLMAGVILGTAVGRWLEDTGRLRIVDDAAPRTALLRGALLAALLSLTVFFYVVQTNPARVQARIEDLYPAEALRVMRAEGLQNTLFNDYGWGGYLILFAPDYPVFMDGRADLYDEFFLDYNSIRKAEDGWEAWLERCRVQTVLITATTPLAEALRTHPDWQVVMEKDEFFLARRRPTPDSEASLIPPTATRDTISAVQANGEITPCPN